MSDLPGFPQAQRTDGFGDGHSKAPLETRVKNMVLSNQPSIEIVVANSEGKPGDLVPSFATFDEIPGKAIITTKHDTKFDDIEISFVGIGKTYKDGSAVTPAAAGRMEATYRFLRLVQPVSREELPAILEANKTYEFPFVFILPDRLLPKACPHRVESEQVREAHLCLPPSLGDGDTTGPDGKVVDDLCPHMSKIEYGLRVVISKLKRPDSEGANTIIAEKFKKVKVKPAFDERPPIHIKEDSAEFQLRAEKWIRRSMLKMFSKTGKLIMESAQPRAFMLPLRDSNASITTKVHVDLRFEPRSPDDEPPKLSKLESKLKTVTYYTVAPRFAIPERRRSLVDYSLGVHAITLPLSVRSMTSVNWKKHTSSEHTSSEPVATTLDVKAEADAKRSGSEVSFASSSDAKDTAEALSSPKATNSGVYYTANILVPVELPKTKHFVPTFHGCLTSRTYGISLHLSLASSKATPSSTLTVRVPVQIGQEGSPARQEAQHAYQTALDAGWEADMVFEPRRPTIVDPDLVRSHVQVMDGEPAEQDRPPRYQAFTRAVGGFAPGAVGASLAL